MLTDLHPSNIFVDENWQVTCLIDLEWTCSQPAEMLHPQYWLTGRAIDQLTDEHLDAYRAIHEEFMAIWELEVQAYIVGVHYGDVMRAGWTNGNFWYFSAVHSFNGLYGVFLQHIQPLYGASRDWKDFERIVAPYWTPGASEFIREKVGERDRYLERLRQLFRGASAQND